MVVSIETRVYRRTAKTGHVAGTQQLSSTRYTVIHQMPTGNAAIRKANKATVAELAVSVPALYQTDGRQFRISVRTAKDLSEHERAQIWELFEENMYTLYVDSSFGWTPKSKKQEMFDARSRFIIASQEDALTPNPPDIVAYTIFRFDREERQDVVYWYALSDFRRPTLACRV